MVMMEEEVEDEVDTTSVLEIEAAVETVNFHVIRGMKEEIMVWAITHIVHARIFHHILMVQIADFSKGGEVIKAAPILVTREVLLPRNPQWQTQNIGEQKIVDLHDMEEGAIQTIEVGVLGLEAEVGAGGIGVIDVGVEGMGDGVIGVEVVGVMIGVLPEIFETWEEGTMKVKMFVVETGEIQEVLLGGKEADHLIGTPGISPHNEIRSDQETEIGIITNLGVTSIWCVARLAMG